METLETVCIREGKGKGMAIHLPLAMASPLLSERVSSAILRSLCADPAKMHGLAVVRYLEKQQLRIELAREVTVLTFADAVNVAGYDARGMFDDFFPRYPYKTTRNSWRYFHTWVTEGTRSLYQDFCLEWIDLAQKCLRECHACRNRSRRPTWQEVERIFGIWRPYYIGERPSYMYMDDDKLVQESDLYPVAGGLVVENADVGPNVKVERDAPPGFPWPLTHYEVGGPSEVRAPVSDVMVVMSPLGSSSENTPAAAAGGGPALGIGDPMLFDPDVHLMQYGHPGSSSCF